MATATGKTNQPTRMIPLFCLGIFLVAVVGAILWQVRPHFNNMATVALLEASRSQDSTGIREAIQAGADPNARFPERRNFLGTAALWLRSLSPLRPKDAKFARRELSIRPYNALTLAVQVGDTQTVSTLLNAGADPNLPTGYGWTSLAYAANVSAFIPDSSLAITRLLLAAGAEPNRRDFDGATPLLVALYSRAPASIVRLLLEAGADTTVRMSTGATVQNFLTSGTNPEIVQLFQGKKQSSLGGG